MDSHKELILLNTGKFNCFFVSILVVMDSHKEHKDRIIKDLDDEKFQSLL